MEMEKITSLIKELGFDDFIFVATRGEEVTLSLCDNAITALGLIEYARIEAKGQIGEHNESSSQHKSTFHN